MFIEIKPLALLLLLYHGLAASFQRSMLSTSQEDSGGTSITSSYFEVSGFGTTIGLHRAAVRFGAIDVPQYATVTTATIQFLGYSDSDNQAAYSLITAEASSTPAAFTAGANDLGPRAGTGGSVVWDIKAFGDDDPDTSPNVAVSMQELVCRSDWTSGNSVVIMFDRLTGTTTDRRAFHDPIVLDVGYTTDVYCPATETMVQYTSNNYGEEISSGGTVDVSGQTLTLGHDGGGCTQPRSVAVRFPSVNVARGVTVQRAFLQFSATKTEAGPIDLRISAEASGTPAPIVSSNADVTSRTSGTESVVWEVPSFTENEVYQSPSLVDVLQQAIDRGDWVAGNPMVFLITRNDGGNCRQTSTAVVLHVTTFAPAGAYGDPHMRDFHGHMFLLECDESAVFNLFSSAFLQVNVILDHPAGLPPSFNAVITHVGVKVRTGARELLFSVDAQGTVQSDHTGLASQSQTGEATQFCFGDILATAGVGLRLTSHDISLQVMPHRRDPTGGFSYTSEYLDVALFRLNAPAHGIIGQTLQNPQKLPRMARMIELRNPFDYLDGKLEDYKIADGDLFGDEFAYNVYT